MYNLTYKSVSVMKKTRENSSAQITTAEKQNLVACLANMGVTHVEITMFADDNASLISHGFTPSPRTIEAETQDWYSVIHAQPNVYGSGVFGGFLKVYDRAIFCGIEAIEGFAADTGTPVGTSAAIQIFTDNFTRGSVGANYTTAADGGTGNTWTVSGTELVGPAADGWKRSCLTVATYYNFTAQAKVKKVGDQQLVVRATTDSNFPGYGFQLRTGEFRLERPGLAQLGTAAKTFSEGSYYQVKVQCSGTAIMGKVWLDGTSEPGTWDISITDSTFSSGLIGFSGQSSTGVFDDLVITPIVGTTTWCERYYNYLLNHVTPAKFATGDIQCPVPEISARAFSGSFFTSQSGVITCVQQFHAIATALYATVGKTCVFLNNPNFSEVTSGWFGAGAYSDTGIVCYDYYGGYRRGNNLTPTDLSLPADYTYDVNQTYAGTSLAGYGVGTASKPQFFGEWGDLSGSIHLRKGTPTGDNWVTGTTSNEDWMTFWMQFLTAIKALVDAGKISGFNYWGGWEDQNTSILYKVGSGSNSQYFPNWRGQMLANFYKGNGGMARLPVIKAGTFTEANPSFGGRNMHF